MDKFHNQGFVSICFYVAITNYDATKIEFLSAAQENPTQVRARKHAPIARQLSNDGG
jgi:hypothetical protein